MCLRPRIIKDPVVRYSPVGAVFDTYRMAREGPLAPSALSAGLRTRPYLVRMDPPRGRSCVVRPGGRQADAELPRLLERKGQARAR